MAKNVCMNKIYNNYNTGKSVIFSTDTSWHYAENHSTIESFYNGANYLPSRTEKENLTVMSNVKNTIAGKKDSKRLFLNDMENDLHYQNNIPFGNAVCGLKCSDSLKENSKLCNSQTALKLSHSDSCEESTENYRTCYMQSSPGLPPPGQIPKTYQKYVSEKPVFEMVADSLSFSPFQERKSAIVRLAAEGNVARSTLADVNYTASRPGKRGTGREKEFSKSLCKIVKSIGEYNSDVANVKSCLELGTGIARKCRIGDSIESHTEHYDENKDAVSPVLPKKLKKTSLKSKLVDLSRSDSSVDIKFSEQTVKPSSSFDSSRHKSVKNVGNQKCSFSVAANTESSKKSKARKRHRRITSGHGDQNQNLVSERDMPQLIPLSDVSSDVQDSKDIEQDDDDVVNVPDSPEMPVLIPFTSENEEPPQIKTENLHGSDHAVTPVPSRPSKMRSPKEKIGSLKTRSRQTDELNKTMAPQASPSRGLYYMNHDIIHDSRINKIFQPQVLLYRLSGEDMKPFYKGNSVKKKTFRRGHRKKFHTKKYIEKDKNIKTVSEEKCDKNIKTATVPKYDIVRLKAEPVCKKKCEGEKENKNIDAKLLHDGNLGGKTVEMLGDTKEGNNVETWLKKTSHGEKEMDLTSQPSELMLLENSEDPEVDVIDGVNFFSFRSKKTMEQFSEKHGGTFSCFFDDEDFDSTDSFDEYKGMIIPTKTTDITQIKGWQNKYFAPETHFIKAESTGNDGHYSMCDIDEDSFGKPEIFSPHRIATSTPTTSTPAGVVKPLEKASKSKNSKSAFISDALDSFLKNESKLQVSFLQKINPNISPIPPDASILSLGSLRKEDDDSLPHLSARHSKILISKNLAHRFDDATSESGSEVTNSDWNSSVKEYLSDSEYFYPSEVSKQEKHDESPVLKKKIKLDSHEETPNPQRLVLKLQKQGCGNRDGYKVADIFNASSNSEKSNLKIKTENPITECSDGCPLPLIRKTMFTSKNDRKLLGEFLGNLNRCGKMKDLDPFLCKSNKIHFDCPVVNEKHIRKTLSSLPHSANMKSSAKKNACKIKKLLKKLPAPPKITSQSLKSQTTVFTGMSAHNLNVANDPRGKRRIRLPARYLDSALIVAGSEWVSPVSDFFEDERTKILKRRKIECAEETDSSRDALSEENILEQFPNATWSSENVLNNNSEGDLSVSLCGSSQSQTCVNDCHSSSCSRTMIYSVFSKKLLCKCQLPKVSEEIFSEKVARSLSSKDLVPSNANHEGVTSVTSIGDEHSYSYRVQTKSDDVNKAGSSENNHSPTCQSIASASCVVEEKCVTSKSTAEKDGSQKTDMLVLSQPLANEGNPVQNLNKELGNNHLGGVTDSSVLLKIPVSQNSASKVIQPSILKIPVSSKTQNTLAENCAADSQHIIKGNDTATEKNTVSGEHNSVLCTEKEAAKCVDAASPERNKYALVLVPMKSPVKTQQNCIQGKYIKVAKSPTNLPPSVSLLSGKSLSVLKCPTTANTDGVNLLANSSNTCRTIGTVNLKGNLKTPFILKTFDSTVSHSIPTSSNPIFSTSAVLCTSTKTVSSQQSLQNTLISNFGSRIIPDVSLHSNDVSRYVTQVSSSFRASSTESLANVSTSHGSLPTNSHAVNLIDSKSQNKCDVKVSSEKSTSKHIQLTSIKVGDKVVFYPSAQKKSIMNVKMMNNNLAASNKLPPLSVSGNQNLNNSRQTTSGPTVVTISPSLAKIACLSVASTTSSVTMSTTSSVTMGATSSVAMGTTTSIAMGTTTSIAMGTTTSIAMGTTSNVAMDTISSVAMGAANSVCLDVMSDACLGTASGVPLEKSEKSVNEPEAVSLTAHDPATVLENTASECRDFDVCEHSDSEMSETVLKSSPSKTENDTVDVVTVEDGFDVLEILKRQSENMKLSSSDPSEASPVMITVGDSDISDESESDEESSSEELPESHAEKKSAQERKRRQQISEAAEILRMSSPRLENSTSLVGLLDAAIDHIAELKEEEVKLQCSKYRALCIRAAVLARFRKLAIEAPIEIRKTSVMKLLRNLQSNNLLKAPSAAAGSSLDLSKPFSKIKLHDDDSRNSRLRAVLQENSVKECKSPVTCETDSKSCEKTESSQKDNNDAPMDVKKTELRKQIWNDSCRSRFSSVPVTQENNAKESKPDVRVPPSRDGSPNVDLKALEHRKQVWKESCMSRFSSVAQENSAKDCKAKVLAPPMKYFSLSSNNGVPMDMKKEVKPRLLAPKPVRQDDCKPRFLAVPPENLATESQPETSVPPIGAGSENSDKSVSLDMRKALANRKSIRWNMFKPILPLPVPENLTKECLPEFSVPPAPDLSLHSNKEKESSELVSTDDSDVNELNTNPLVVDIGDHSSDDEKNSSKSKGNCSQMEGSKQVNTNALAVDSELSQKEELPPKRSGILKKKNEFPGLIPLINSHQVRKHLLESGRNISIQPLHPVSSSGLKDNEKILCQTRISNSEDFRRRTISLGTGGSITNMECVSVASHNPVNNYAHRNSSNFAVGERRSVKDCSSNAINFPHTVSQAKIESSHLRGILSSSSSRDIGVNMQIPSEARTMSRTSATYVPILSGPYGLQKVNLNSGKTVFAYEQVSKCDFSPSKNTTVRQIILPPPPPPPPPPPSMQVIKSQMNSVSFASSTSCESTTQSTASVTQPCAFPSLMTDVNPVTTCESKLLAPLLEPVQPEPRPMTSGENVKRSSSPSCDDVPVWVSTVTGDACIVTRINSDEEEEDNGSGSHCTTEELVLPTIVSCSTISEERFYQDLEEDNL